MKWGQVFTLQDKKEVNFPLAICTECRGNCVRTFQPVKVSLSPTIAKSHERMNSLEIVPVVPGTKFSFVLCCFYRIFEISLSKIRLMLI